MNAITLPTRSSTEPNSPRLSSRRVRIEKNSSTWFSHEAWLGVEWGWKRGWSTNHQRVSRAMCEEPLSSTRCTSSPAGTLASRSSRKSMKLAAVLRSRSVAVKIPPRWTSRAASRVAVPWRTYSCSWRAGRPGAGLVVGVDQGAAWALAVLEAGQAFGLEAMAPVGDGVLVHAHHRGDLAVGEAVGGQQHDPSPFCGPLGGGV